MSRKGWNKIRESNRPRRLVYLDYHAIPFAKFHYDLRASGFNTDSHTARSEFWQLVPPGQYTPEHGNELVTSYLISVEARLAAIVSEQSLAYWLHVYRRLPRYSIGPDARGTTVGLVRMTLEAAFQKYAQAGLCSRIAYSTEVAPVEILNGFIVNDKDLWETYRETFLTHPQLVLTRFGVPELAKFYSAEKLAFEVWKGSAVLRALGKGAPLRVFDGDEYFADDRSPELDELLKSYDERAGSSHVSATGTVFSSPKETHSVGVVFLPRYNLEHYQWAMFLPLIEQAFNLSLTGTVVENQEAEPNFLWAPFNLLDFYNAHKPFAAAFQQTHGIKFESVVAMIATLVLGTFRAWREEPRVLMRAWLRAYDGPDSLSLRIATIRDSLPFALAMVPLEISEADVELEAAVRFLSWSDETRAAIDLVVAGPHSLFLPVGERVFTDYAWIAHRLFRMSHRLKVDDQNFKGDALEILVRNGNSALPTKACKAHDGSSKQTDVAFDCGELLLIVECKVKGISIGWERGDRAAVLERQKFLYEAIRQADDKAIWLSHRPVGRNYNISKYKWILAVVVTPFAEFIWNKEEYDWINGKLPRIMTVAELEDALEDDVFSSVGPHHQMAMPVRDIELR